MPRFILALVLIAAFACPAHAVELQACYTGSERSKWELREHTDTRVRAIYIDILKRSRMRAELFSICEYDGPIPGMMLVVTSDGREIFELVAPSYMRTLSDKQVTGLVAHEVAHVAVGFRLVNSIASEAVTDAKAAQWVGNGTVIAGLSAIYPELWRFGPDWKERLENQLDQRVRALLALP